MLQFNLPCKPYVKHYLQNCFGSPIYLRQDSQIGKYFFMLVEDVVQKYDKECKTDYKAIATIKITEDVFLKKGCVLTKTNIRKFNVFVEDHFKQQVFIILDTVTQISEMKIKEAIDYMYDYFDMTESFLALDTVVKAYYREKRTRNTLLTLKINNSGRSVL